MSTVSNPRMTAKTARLVRAADYVNIVGFESRPGAADWLFTLQGMVEGRPFQAFDGKGLTMFYASIGAAEAAVRRHNPTVPLRVKYHEITAA